MADAKQAGAGGAVATGDTVPAPAKKRSLRARLATYAAVFFAVLLVLFFSYRWAGTTTYRGTVQRVYEKGMEYRVEFTTLEGEVRVVGNAEIKFPYFKLDTADVHAELNRLSLTGDVVDLTVWGFRQAWLDMFPNVIEVTFVRSDEDRSRARAERVADAVIAKLREQNVLKGGESVKPGLVEAIATALSTPSQGRAGEKTAQEPKEPAEKQ